MLDMGAGSVYNDISVSPRGVRMKKNDPRSLLMLTASMVIFGSIGIFRPIK